MTDQVKERNSVEYPTYSGVEQEAIDEHRQANDYDSDYSDDEIREWLEEDADKAEYEYIQDFAYEQLEALQKELFGGYEFTHFFELRNTPYEFKAKDASEFLANSVFRHRNEVSCTVFEHQKGNTAVDVSYVVYNGSQHVGYSLVPQAYVIRDGKTNGLVTAKRIGNRRSGMGGKMKGGIAFYLCHEDAEYDINNLLREGSYKIELANYPEYVSSILYGI